MCWVSSGQSIEWSWCHRNIASTDAKSHSVKPNNPITQLEDKLEQAQKEEVNEILKNQKVLYDLISTNSEAIKNICNEITKLQYDSLKADSEK